MGSQGAATVRSGRHGVVTTSGHTAPRWLNTRTLSSSGHHRGRWARTGSTCSRTRSGRGRASSTLPGETTEKDLHSMGELPPEEGRHPDREYRGGLQEWPEADAAAGGHLRRDLT